MILSSFNILHRHVAKIKYRCNDDIEAMYISRGVLTEASVRDAEGVEGVAEHLANTLVNLTLK